MSRLDGVVRALVPRQYYRRLPWVETLAHDTIYENGLTGRPIRVLTVGPHVEFETIEGDLHTAEHDRFEDALWAGVLVELDQRDRL